MVTVRIVSIDNDKISGIEIGDDIENNIIEIPMNRNIYLGLLTEMKKVNILVDSELSCFNNRVFTIVEKEWKRPPKDLNVEPIVFGVTLRKDLENMTNVK